MDTSPPERLNLALAAGLGVVHLAVLVALPLWLLPLSPLWGWLLLLPMALTPTLWSLTHEAVHGSLARARPLNDRLGRLLAGLYGAPFQVLRLGHLMHHRFNRTALNRVEVVESAPPTPRERAGYYARLFGGLYLGEIACAPLAILPKRARGLMVALAFGAELEDGRSMAPAARRQLLEEPGRTKMRTEGVLIALGLAGALALFGAHWWMLALALLGRGLVVSGLDNVYHYGNALDERAAGSDLPLPRPLRLLFLNFNYHGTHHARPHLPWTALPGAFVELDRRFAGPFSTALWRQLDGPIPEQAFVAQGAGDEAGPEAHDDEAGPGRHDDRAASEARDEERQATAA
ncbi:MAG: fatty acid desaturase [Paracoccaceae bacterium]